MHGKGHGAWGTMFGCREEMGNGDRYYSWGTAVGDGNGTL